MTMSVPQIVPLETLLNLSRHDPSIETEDQNVCICSILIDQSDLHVEVRLWSPPGDTAWQMEVAIFHRNPPDQHKEPAKVQPSNKELLQKWQCAIGLGLPVRDSDIPTPTWETPQHGYTSKTFQMAVNEWCQQATWQATTEELALPVQLPEGMKFDDDDDSLLSGFSSDGHHRYTARIWGTIVRRCRRWEEVREQATHDHLIISIREPLLQVGAAMRELQARNRKTTHLREGQSRAKERLALAAELGITWTGPACGKCGSCPLCQK